MTSMLPGQTLPTVTRWTVREGSVVTIGANHNALVFYDRESKQIIDSNDKGNLIRLIDHSNNPKKQLKMSVLTGVLKLQDSASEAEIVTAIQGNHCQCRPLGKRKQDAGRRSG
ncbi:hypothetical protein NXW60_20630 [Bacteroides fragilis]|nr:hypothetical protein NXW60_20630 [Bacteroides fragilis]